MEGDRRWCAGAPLWTHWLCCTQSFLSEDSGVTRELWTSDELGFSISHVSNVGKWI